MYPVSATVPHASPMLLLDRIEAYGDAWLQAWARLQPGNLFVENNAIPAWVGIEYMAQTIAAWAGCVALDRGEPIRIGFLVGSRKYKVSCAEFPIGSQMLITIREVLMGENGLGAFECLIEGTDPDGGQFNASATLNVYQPDNLSNLVKDIP